MEKEKVKLKVLGFSFNQTQTGTYGLVLAEDGGRRRLMVIVGTPELNPSLLNCNVLFRLVL